MRAIAFYLPQFHRIPENDKWWGEGFTEWTNVKKSCPLFKGHYQPRIPRDFGYYDLKDDAVSVAQTELARRYGIFGFCYYYYWFNGKKLLDLPLRNMLNRRESNFPFCLCYANENWTRRWDGGDKKILIAQEHNSEDDRRFISELIPIMRDTRYIRIDGKPILLIYRSMLFPDIAKTVSIWRDEAMLHKEEIYLIKCQTFPDEYDNPLHTGFDASVEFPPHIYINGNFLCKKQEQSFRYKNSLFPGQMYDYNIMAEYLIKKKRPIDYTLFRTVMLGWDNTPRRGVKGVVFNNFSIPAYQRWLAAIARQAEERDNETERIVFINAWNEWAEGTYLEPDTKYGHSLLEATRDVISK